MKETVEFLAKFHAPDAVVIGLAALLDEAETGGGA